MSDTIHSAVKVAENIYWVGAVDWSVRDFHGYATQRGTSYNAFLILAEEPILVDTVKKPFGETMFSRIAELCDPADIRYVISNHAEMDHSGWLPEIVRRCDPETIFTSAKGAEALADHFHASPELLDKLQPVGDGEQRTIAGLDFTFLETRMLHWPDSMFSYCHPAKTLFSSDAFGMHLASSERFTDELPWSLIHDEMAKYYANILLPFSKLITKLLERVGGLNLPLELVACDHGPIWRRDFDKILERYGRWAAQAPTAKAVVVYDTMWGSTAAMAQAVAEGLAAGGVQVKVHPLSGSHRSDVATEILDAGALVVGSPTLNQNLFPTVADTLTYLKGLQPRNMVAGAFGSYGWSSKAVGQIASMLGEMNLELPCGTLDVKYAPKREDLSACRAYGEKLAGALKATL